MKNHDQSVFNKKNMFIALIVYSLKITNNLKLRAGVCRKLALKLPS